MANAAQLSQSNKSSQVDGVLIEAVADVDLDGEAPTDDAAGGVEPDRDGVTGDQDTLAVNDALAAKDRGARLIDAERDCGSVEVDVREAIGETLRLGVGDCDLVVELEASGGQLVTPLSARGSPVDATQNPLSSVPPVSSE